MANTYTQLYIQMVFVVKGRQNLIPKVHKAAVYKYITGVIQERKHKLLAINGMPDHIHILLAYTPIRAYLIWQKKSKQLQPNTSKNKLG